MASEPETLRSAELKRPDRTSSGPGIGDDVVVKRHDRYQFEVKLHLDVTTDRRTDRYRVESYFFIPQSLDINEKTYSKGQFFRDLLVYLRLKTPVWTLRALADADHPRNPLKRLSEELDAPARGDPPSARAQYEIRLLGCIIKSALRDHVRLTERRLDLGHGGAARLARLHGQIAALVPDLTAIVRRFRALGTRIRGDDRLAALRSSWAYTDEYISLLIEWRVLQLIEMLERQRTAGRQDGSATLIASLGRLVEQEIAYRKEAGYPSVLAGGESDGELFVYRFGVLKKFVAQVLYLSMWTAPEGRGLREAALALAAGGAMVFATAVAFYYQRIYGTLSLGFFAALVVSYMFKDRIKALLQNALHKLLSRTLPDQTTRIFNLGDGRRIGTCSETVQFVDEVRLDPEIRRLRDRSHLTDVENDYRSEKVLYYLKKITLFPARFGRSEHRKRAVTDILRFNVQQFLKKMDEPETPLKTWKEGRCVEVTARRVYHVNLIFRLVTPRRTVRCERIRLVLDQNGIRRIEPVLASRHPEQDAGRPPL